LISVFVRKDGRTECTNRVDPTWLDRGSGVTFWVDLAAPTPEEARLLSDVFRFHELAIEDALSEIHHPKAETYDGYLYVILHGIAFQAARHRFATHDVDFFLGLNYLVTVHDGASRSIAKMRDLCPRNEQLLADGPAGLFHRIVDTMVDNYRPEVEKLNDRINTLEKEVFERPRPQLVRTILNVKRDIASLRQVTLPQRDVVGRLARREFPQISEQLVYRFRDVHDHLVHLSDESLLFYDRVTGLLDAHLSNVSNQLNSVMKVLTVIATIFMPLTVLTGMFGMNVHLPTFPGGARAQFWWILALMIGASSGMLWAFKRRNWL
jgi:magnesium transporter